MSLAAWSNLSREIGRQAQPNRMTDEEIEQSFADLRAMNLPDMRLPN